MASRNIFLHDPLQLKILRIDLLAFRHRLLSMYYRFIWNLTPCSASFS